MEENISRTPLSPALIALIAIATGLVVASNYYAQPLLDTIALQFNLTVNEAGFIVTTAQLSYAVGLTFLVPLGDMFERRSLIVSMTILATIGLLITATSQNIWQMLLGTAMTGLFSVVAQILVPLAATLALPHQRGKAVGTIMSGLLLGILLARTISGTMATLGGWRTVFWVASVLLVILSLTLWRYLPRYKQVTNLSYFQLLGSIVNLITTSPLLRVRAILGALTFANFSLLWTSMAFLLSAPPFNYSEGVIGLFGLVGAAGALMATQTGRLVDKGKGPLTTSISLVLLLLSWIPIGLVKESLIGFIIGVFLLDIAIQGVHVTNQSTIYRIMPEARNRLTAAYMTSYFIGGALGSLVSGYAYKHSGWYGVATAGIAICIISLIVWFLGKKYEPKTL
ncbi:MFS transporter [Photorhabdus laumondii subsp. laumondii]|uniref:Photorhabdus luminescens subsp. laumondii TTO1 complete genome segment 5/17 n=3 Tax=Photorhabdus laumondii TaxID=2218628 RepID=Q7N778_PHOLL|nr:MULTISPECIES: MFS transporter [Photorhabdus]PQQ36599.1 MFS transporter [Photorhabdus luminescens]AWK41164.1 transporter [Photorhabdus laumondii subsp. laumondii]AXG41898.1 MFS transporter [Photorhabdus laumondii subsp. laumondii]AXG46485.1 MFS transporter [Photorhabdus laumondii subsp. laumondii]KTL62296.1 transporter [Photorhabdus laumondii subsp. laumondii]